VRRHYTLQQRTGVSRTRGCGRRSEQAVKRFGEWEIAGSARAGGASGRVVKDDANRQNQREREVAQGGRRDGRGGVDEVRKKEEAAAEDRRCNDEVDGDDDMAAAVRGLAAQTAPRAAAKCAPKARLRT